MAAPREQVPDSGVGLTGNPIIDSANALNETAQPATLDNNKPAHSSPLKSTVVAADIGGPSTLGSSEGSSRYGTTSQGVNSDASLNRASTESAQHESTPVEGILSAIGGAIVTAPAAALEAVSSKLPAVVETVKAKTGSLAGSAASTTSNSSIASNVNTHDIASTISETAHNIAAQATELAQQAIHRLPESVTSHLPTQLVGGTTTQKEKAATGEEAYDFTKPHTTANFEASGSLQATHNPELVEAQSDLAVKAQTGDL